MFENFCASGFLRPVVFANMTDKGQLRTGLGHDLIQKTSTVEYHELWLGVLLRCQRYGPISWLAYPQMLFG